MIWNVLSSILLCTWGGGKLEPPSVTVCLHRITGIEYIGIHGQVNCTRGLFKRLGVKDMR